MKHRSKARKINTKYFSAEDHIQFQIIEWIKLQHKDVLCIHVPNEGRGKISWTQMERIKALGVRKGASDLLFFDPRHGYNGLAMEVKTPKGVVSKEQRTFLADLKSRGWLTSVVRGFDEAKEIIDAYFNQNQSRKNGNTQNSHRPCY